MYLPFNRSFVTLIKMEPNIKRERLQDLWDPEQVRKIFVLGGKEFLLELDVMEVAFAYEAYPQIRERFKTEHLWNMIYHEKIVPQLLDLGLEPRTLGGNERQNCLAWAFALKMYSLENPSESNRDKPSKWYCNGEFRRADGASGRVTLIGNFIFFDVDIFNHNIRARVLREYVDEIVTNPSFATQMLEDRIQTCWKGMKMQHLAYVLSVFLNEGFSMVVHWHNGSYNNSKSFFVREKL